MESSKRLLEVEYQLKILSDFVGRGNYGMVLGVQSHSTALDGLDKRCLEMADELRVIADLIAHEVAIARSKLNV